jgi:hypothetical protein
VVGDSPVDRTWFIDNIISSCSSCRRGRERAHLAEELLEILRLFNLVGRLDATLANRLLEELGHLEADLEQLALLLVLWCFIITESEQGQRDGTLTNRPSCVKGGEQRRIAHLLELVGKGGREHVGEELEGDGEEKFHEGYDEEDGEGDQTKEVLSRALELYGSRGVVSSVRKRPELL